MLAMFSVIEIVVVLFIGMVLLAVAGIATYAVIRRAARDGTRDAARAAASTPTQD